MAPPRPWLLDTDAAVTPYPTLPRRPWITESFSAAAPSPPRRPWITESFSAAAPSPPSALLPLPQSLPAATPSSAAPVLFPPPQSLPTATPTASAPHPICSSPRVAPGGLHVQGGGGQLGNKRKSPCATMPLFRSPLSRMFLSPRIPLPRAQLGSSSVRHNTLPRSPLHGIDLNVAPKNNDQEKQRGKKRKSPYVTMPLFRSPVSRMFLSPRISTPRAQLGSPSVRHNTSPRIPLHGIDLNVRQEENDSDPEGTALVNAKLRLPVVLNKFLQPITLSPEEFSLSGKHRLFIH